MATAGSQILSQDVTTRRLVQNKSPSDLIGSRGGRSSFVSTSDSPSTDISSSEMSSVVVLVSSDSLSSGSGGQV